MASKWIAPSSLDIYPTCALAVRDGSTHGKLSTRLVRPLPGVYRIHKGLSYQSPVILSESFLPIARKRSYQSPVDNSGFPQGLFTSLADPLPIARKRWLVEIQLGLSGPLSYQSPVSFDSLGWGCSYASALSLPIARDIRAPETPIEGRP